MTPERIEEIKRRYNEVKPFSLWGLYVFELLAALEEAQQTIARQQQKIDAALSWTWNCSEANMLEVIAALKGDEVNG